MKNDYHANRKISDCLIYRLFNFNNTSFSFETAGLCGHNDTVYFEFAVNGSSWIKPEQVHQHRSVGCYQIEKNFRHIEI